MNDFPVAYVIGLDHTRHHMLSARPDSPVVESRPHNRRASGRVRIALAARLYATADRVSSSGQHAQRAARPVADC